MILIDYLFKSKSIGKRGQGIIGWDLGIERLNFSMPQLRSKEGKNHIRGIFSDSGDWRSDEKGMAGIFLKYFQSLFLTSHPPTQVLQEVLALVEPCVSDITNEVLMASFTSAEVRRAVFYLHPQRLQVLMVLQLFSFKNLGLSWVMISRMQH